MKIKHEIRRVTLPIEIREDDDGTVSVAGYAAVFGERADIGGFFTESIRKGAFAEAVKRDDVVFLVNHEGLPLARTSSGTLKLKEDKRGLHMESTLDLSDPDVQRIKPKMERGDMSKMSFAFIATRQEWEESDDIPHREIIEAELFDVSIVTNPAYDGTEIGLRALEDYRKTVKQRNFNAANRRIREKQADRALSTIDEHVRHLARVE